MTLRILAGVALALMLTATEAQTIAPDSLVCEGRAEVELMATSKAGGAATIRAAQDIVRFYAMVRDQADGPLRTVGKSRQDQIDNADRMAAPYQRLVATCASWSGPATVLEVSPISGIARVRVTMGGRQADIWTSTRSIAP